MYQVFETILIQPQGIPLFPYHLARMQGVAQQLWQKTLHVPDLQTELLRQAEGRVCRCRLLYDADGYQLQTDPWMKRSLHALHLVHAPHLKYTIKYTDRRALQQRLHGLRDAEDVLILQ